jgi:hypothetical protein
MSRLQSIENALISINDVVFQELCDSFLSLRNKNYSAFARSGSQIGKQKSVKGTPDSIFLLPSGKYLFVEYSTNVTKGLAKIKEDILKCTDSTKSKIPSEQIAEIIICINFNIKPSELHELKSLLSNTRISFTLISLQSLAIELHFNHRDLVNQYLGLPFDTGQVVSIENFVKEYGRAANSIATPLDNIFLYRDRELQELKESIQQTDFIILTGPSGVGKTKLAIEAIQQFKVENPSFGAYCISYKSYSLLEDLYQYFDLDKNYILFVDDANRIDALGQITGFYRAVRTGILKIIITVRDYAFMEISLLCQEFLPKRIDIPKLTDEQIVGIISSDSFKIRNKDYQREIVRIADGNPRLAIMASLLAKSKQNLHVLADVSDLFEKYFSTFIKDKNEFAVELNIKCLGIIAFFYTIPYKDKLTASTILGHFNIDYNDFIEAVDKLDRLELVEAQFEHVKIPEQNLSTYFFYRSFIKDELLPFDVLLKNYYESHTNRFRDCIIPANNTFGYQNVMNKLKPKLQNYFSLVRSDESKAFKFLESFWFYLQSETKEFFFNRIQLMPIPQVNEYDLTFEGNTFAFEKDKSIELLSEFFRFPTDLEQIIELSFEYARRTPNKVSELLHKIKEEIAFDSDDQNYHWIICTFIGFREFYKNGK